MVLRMKLLAAGMAAVAVAGTAAAQTAVRETTTTSTTEVRKASVVMNANVVVEGGTSVGKITDFVISDGGCIEYVVIDSESKYVLVPYSVIRVEGDRHVVSVNVTREKWRDIPTFTGTNWPLRDEAYLSKVRTTFGVRESGYGRDGDRRPLDNDRRDDRRDNRTDRRDDRRDQPPDRPQQRRDVENPNRNNPPPATRPDPNRTPPDTNRNTVPDRPRTPPPPPPGTPGTNPPPPERERPPVSAV
jgi:hypothetical protein